MRSRCWSILILAILLNYVGCSSKQRSREKPSIGVTTSWLEAAVRDVAGQDVDVVCLLPPGDCPGHFDLSPGMVRRLSRCEILFRFGFQSGVDEKLSGLTSRGLRIVEVVRTDGLCIPDVYLDACGQIADVLGGTSAAAEELRDRLSTVESRLSGLSASVHRKIEDAGLRGEKVLCSDRQEQFCRWLGLDVAATFPRADDMSSSSLQELLSTAQKSNVRAVIANLQEGRKAADSIAQRLDATVIVFSNFPSKEAAQAGFEELLLDNVRSLIEGTRR